MPNMNYIGLLIKKLLRKVQKRTAYLWSFGAVRKITVGTLVVAVVLAVLVNSAVSAPPTFAIGTLFHVEEGMTFGQIAKSLQQEGFIRSPVALKVIAQLFFKNTNSAVAGDYSFDQRVSAFEITRRILAGDFRLDPIKVTIPEGLNKFETASLLSESLPKFDKQKFLEIAQEGYLFPDTYYFAPNVTAEKIVEVMRGDFDRRVGPHLPEIQQFGRSLSEVVAMASIVETEARLPDTRQTIANILWKRLDQKMPLQVDVSFKYVNGKTTFDLTTDDLAIDSPYNTYKNPGLPPTPIANPGLESILDTITVKKTDFFYFLSDKDGVMHYAATFEQHLANKRKYLP